LGREDRQPVEPVHERTKLGQAAGKRPRRR
jgi:hypothetical protein